jgi:predicted aconitase
MELTRIEERILTGSEGEGPQKAMEVLVSIGEMKDASRLIEVKSVQISGVSYRTIGDAGAEFLKDLSSKDAKIKVLATLNPAGIDLEDENKGVPENFLSKQEEILESYGRLGAKPSCTCTPYLVGNLPSFGESIAWAESSAVAYANSVIGARTNRESAITSLASAITGKTPLYGLHLDENRQPTFIVSVTEDLKTPYDFSTLGFYVGKHFDGIPMFRGIKPDIEGYKALSAGLATGRISMFHVEEKTPNNVGDMNSLDQSEFTMNEMKEVKEELNTCEEPDIICIGCPHCTVDEIKRLTRLNPGKEVWAYTTKQNKSLLKDKINNKNVKLVSDTCMVVQPLKEMGVDSIGTNSTKCAYYSRYLSKLDVKFDTLKNLLE